MPSADPAAARVITGYQSAVADARRRIIAFVKATWGGLENYRGADIDRFVARVVPIVAGGQRHVAALTDSYLATIATVVLGQPTRPVGVPASVVTDVRGIPSTEVYQRTGPTVWTALSKGDPLEVAVAKGLTRAVSIASTDLQLARTRSAQHVMAASPSVVGYRRELSGGASCALCMVASTQRYHSEELMPIHPGCSCGVVPIYGTQDPGQVIDADTLDDVHQAITDRFGTSDASGKDPVDYRNVLVTHEHGEIGPVLAVRGQAFTGPDDL